jgi:5'-deoxynucleotidase YfbR-like HD superfamily hydrolase
VFSGLSSVNRYSMIHLGNPESVLEHIGMVTMLSSFLAREMNCRDPWCVQLDMVVCKALVHDIDELIVGDIPRPTKYHSKSIRDMFRQVEEMGVKKVVTEMDLCAALSDEVVSDHRNAKEGREGLIVAVADALAVVYKVWEEVLVRNNMGMIRQANTVGEQLIRLREKIMAEFKDARMEATRFLLQIVDEACDLMERAADKEDPVHGAIAEEMVTE